MMVIDEAGESEEDDEGNSPQGGRAAHHDGFRRVGSSGAVPPRQGQQLLQSGISQKAAQQLMYRYVLPMCRFVLPLCRYGKY